MERLKKGVAVVTGSSSGIGEAVSEALVQHGLTVVGLARRQNKLQALSERLSADKKKYPGKFYPYKCDISIEKEIRDTFASIKKNLGPISVLVNNAGVMVKDDIKLLEVSGYDFDVVFGTNVKGSLICTQEAIRSMEENDIEGHVITVNSLSGLPEHNNMTIFNLYSSAKNALRVQSEAIRREISKYATKIKVTNIFPGGTKSEIMREFELPEPIYDPHLELLPTDVARYIISILDTPPTVLVSELTIVPIIHHF
ncbi:hypothetical protein V9T40_003900 [Parthenolecanium corni]|uniref:Farnesol dehydrogenase-like n=1 Tax=Parthenolecanium corni TaxID=536013 RepID=A0AAN9Y363_9HEMI